MASSLLPGVELTSMSRATFAIGAAAFVGSAALLARIEDVRYPPLLWVVPVVPVVILGVLMRDAISRFRRPAAAPEPTARVRRSPAFVPPLEQGAIREERAHGMLRARAANPSASPQELASIAYSHPEIRATIAGNPAAPANLLEWLAAVGDTAVHAAISAREPAAIPGRITAA
ncbi:hypothetical protein [Demequina muriae]|uniref:Leucine rich repeat variant domain-containing protein n=1 Tax=Demequina muriae TaxID=3051664 RepID=A0ABT8GG49_9MICO|nr:hypothetical protein [Demequina sp. EGI L300058]MDN4480400.1 hypothetical protein [Demequina sp. EGI L300058]